MPKPVKDDGIANVVYVGKKWITHSMFLTWYANVLMQKAYKAQNREFSNFYICYHGSSGIGKTALMKAFLRYHTALMEKTGGGPFFTGGIHKLNLAAMAGEDLEIPVANHKTGTMDRICTVKFGDGPCIVQIDELNRYQSLETVNAVTRVVMDRDGSQKPAPGSLVVAAANSGSYAGTKEFPEHLITRGIHIYLSEQGQDAVQANVSYMQENDYPAWMIEAFETAPTTSQDDFEEIATYQPRTLEYVKYLMEAVDKAETHYGIKTPELLVRALISGAIGSNVAAQYLKMRSLEKLPSLGEVLNDPMKAVMPPTTIDMGLRKRYLGRLIDEVSTTPNTAANAGKLAQYIGRYGDEFGRDAMEKLVKVVPSVTSTPEYKNWLGRIPNEANKDSNGMLSAQITNVVNTSDKFVEITLSTGERAICPVFKLNSYRKQVGNDKAIPKACTYTLNKEGQISIQMFS